MWLTCLKVGKSNGMTAPSTFGTFRKFALPAAALTASSRPKNDATKKIISIAEGSLIFGDYVCAGSSSGTITNNEGIWDL